MHKTIDKFSPQITILRKEHREYLRNFKTGLKYPEKGLGDYINSDAFDDLITGDGVSYIVFQTDGDNIIDVVSFFTLVSSAIPYMYRTIDDSEIYEVMCGIPAIRIHMFAVNQKYQDVFWNDKPISALVFETIINIIDEKSKTDFGIKAIYLHALPSSEKFYLKNNMLKAEEYMRPFAGDDDDLSTMYVFIREVKIVFEKRNKKLGFLTRIKRIIAKWLLK